MKALLLAVSLLLAFIAKGPAHDTFTPAQMREDFSYMMEQYERVHPNPTWSLGEVRYNELKQQTLARLDHPMTQLGFWRIIARWNQHFDGHTHVGWPTISPMPAGMMTFPPKSIVQYRDNKIFFSAYEAMPDSLQGCEILAINGHPTAEIIDSIMPYVSHESAAHTNNVILRSLYWFYQAFYGYSSQMEFLYRTTNAENTVLLDRRTLYTWLVQVGDMGEIGRVGVRDRPWHFSIFPEQGVALFEFNTCGPNDKFEQFDSVFSWIPHEVAHQWWGDGIFFEYRDYALSESLNEYIKLQYLKSRGRGYEEQLEYYKAMMERAEKTLPIADIHSVESQDESIAIYHAAPYRLSLMNSTSVNTTLQQLYSKYKHTIVSRDMFLQECETLRFWLMSK